MQPTSTKTSTSVTKRCRADEARARRALPKITADIARIRRAKTHDATSVATDRFILDLSVSGIDPKRKNRLIDHAVGASIGKCEDCFQALEAMRPIPSIAHGCS